MIVDERGMLTYKQVDDQSWALAHGLQYFGVTEGSVVGVLCRDHRGLVIAMAACGKLGARMVLMNTGFAKPQFAEESTEPLPAPARPGGSVILTSGTTGLPKSAPRDKVNTLATAQLVDRIPFPRRGTMVIVSPIFHSTGWAAYGVGAALGNKVVTTRRVKAERTLELIAEHKADMLVAVPTMLQRMVELGPEVIGARPAAPR